MNDNIGHESLKELEKIIRFAAKYDISVSVHGDGECTRMQCYFNGIHLTVTVPDKFSSRFRVEGEDLARLSDFFAKNTTDRAKLLYGDVKERLVVEEIDFTEMTVDEENQLSKDSWELADDDTALRYETINKSVPNRLSIKHGDLETIVPIKPQLNYDSQSGIQALIGTANSKFKLTDALRKNLIELLTDTTDFFVQVFPGTLVLSLPNGDARVIEAETKCSFPKTRFSSAAFLFAIIKLDTNAEINMYDGLYFEIQNEIYNYVISYCWDTETGSRDADVKWGSYRVIPSA